MRHTFENLRVWHCSRRLSARIHALAEQGNFGHGFALREQVCRAAISVMSNIAEGCERGSTKEFLYFLRIARGSAAEVRCQLYAAEDIGTLDPVLARELRNEALAISRQLTSLANFRFKSG
jgi:four helix bundle protein